MAQSNQGSRLDHYFGIENGCIEGYGGDIPPIPQSGYDPKLTQQQYEQWQQYGGGQPQQVELEGKELYGALYCITSGGPA